MHKYTEKESKYTGEIGTQHVGTNVQMWEQSVYCEVKNYAERSEAKKF